MRSTISRAHVFQDSLGLHVKQVRFAKSLILIRPPTIYLDMVPFYPLLTFMKLRLRLIRWLYWPWSKHIGSTQLCVKHGTLPNSPGVSAPLFAFMAFHLCIS